MNVCIKKLFFNIRHLLRFRKGKIEDLGVQETQTLLHEVSGILNSRPLGKCFVDQDDSVVRCLSPEIVAYGCPSVGDPLASTRTMRIARDVYARHWWKELKKKSLENIRSHHKSNNQKIFSAETWFWCSLLPVLVNCSSRLRLEEF